VVRTTIDAVIAVRKMGEAQHGQCPYAGVDDNRVIPRAESDQVIKERTIVNRITPSLWFDANAEEAVTFYTSVFTDSEILNVSRYGEAGPGPEGSVVTISFRLGDQEFIAINGGPAFSFTEAISFMIDCASQDEVDYYWEKLIEGGGRPDQCGWLKDRFGLSWQVVPTVLGELMADEDPEKANRVTQAMLKMTKLDIASLQEAYGQPS
jgi:predicted 3-demethylubiquinone-9 3-methyltransferase (glyoxalase superfamily)